jgi:hypothetical protein
MLTRSGLFFDLTEWRASSVGGAALAAVYLPHGIGYYCYIVTFML